MIKITLEDINRKSPYEITLNNGDFDFTTELLFFDPLIFGNKNAFG